MTECKNDSSHNYYIITLLHYIITTLYNYYIIPSLILSAVDSYNLIYSLACVNMSKIDATQRLSVIV